ncbi:TonB-dependent receptor [Robertkochia aurantiaca]|uniref:TonB-dependent receptor n=1 Tax=Robertkochia aurantiaca TaxID=2873700 RepID=UPI001CCC572B|nr:TonB-dependent receptor [Robertkochia sp. 3YJGBD-33]
MRYLVWLLVGLRIISVTAQQVDFRGKVRSGGEPVPFATLIIYQEGAERVSQSGDDGSFQFESVDPGTYNLTIQAMGFRTLSREVSLADDTYLEFEIQEDRLDLEEVVVTATRNLVSRKDSPVIVDIVGQSLLQANNSLAVADGLNFTPGVRVETNCQNCGFTQVRLNGLDGGYTQVLINSRAVFSALNSVYGLEQIPASIIERVEVVRSGGSALYGSNAIAGTINIITKDPILNSWEVDSYLASVRGDATDRLLNFNASLVGDDMKSGVTFYGMHRNRDAYDANGDGFTELVRLQNTTFGGKGYYKTGERSRLNFDVTVLDEYRRGGDRLDLAPHLTDITEELDHNTFMGGLSFEGQSRTEKVRWSVYSSAQHTDRQSYYGGLGGGRTEQDSTLALNAYGRTNDLSWLSGTQFTFKIGGRDVLTSGVEYNMTRTEDRIPGYDRIIDQETTALGSYVQYEWKPVKSFSALLGMRFDRVAVDGRYEVADIFRESDIQEFVMSPRITLSYAITDYLKFRGGYARGFRAPQAFNEDLHISSVGGEPQFVILSEDLNTEYSDAFTASFNYNETFGYWQTDALIEGFYTRLKDPFVLVSTGATLPNGSIVEEVRNGEGSRVYGMNFELGFSPSDRFSFQAGGTLQRAEYVEPQILFEPSTGEGVPVTTDKFLRNPEFYGFTNISYTPFENIDVDLTGTYTGSMVVPRVINADGAIDLRRSSEFYDLNVKLSWHKDLSEHFHIIAYTGIKNFLNSYQDDFDSGPNRDSDYIYGPGIPRTFFVGLRFGSSH